MENILEVNHIEKWQNVISLPAATEKGLGSL